MCALLSPYQSLLERPGRLGWLVLSPDIVSRQFRMLNHRVSLSTDLWASCHLVCQIPNGLANVRLALRYWICIHLPNASALRRNRRQIHQPVSIDCQTRIEQPMLISLALCVFSTGPLSPNTLPQRLSVGWYQQVFEQLICLRGHIRQ